MKECKHCLEILPLSSFYSYKEKYWTYCKSCESKRKKQQVVNFKRQCLEYKQQFSCQRCGYNKCISALDFHHINSELKDFSISHCRYLILNDKVKMELDKCEVICSNCHREIHSLEENPFNPRILKPKSTSFCIDCNVVCTTNSQRCRECNLIHKRKNIPKKEDLIEDLSKIGNFCAIGRKYNVSDNAVRKWLKIYGLSAGTQNQTET